MQVWPWQKCSPPIPNYSPHANLRCVAATAPKAGYDRYKLSGANPSNWPQPRGSTPMPVRRPSRRVLLAAAASPSAPPSAPPNRLKEVAQRGITIAALAAVGNQLAIRTTGKSIGAVTNQLTIDTTGKTIPANIRDFVQYENAAAPPWAHPAAPSPPPAPSPAVALGLLRLAIAASAALPVHCSLVGPPHRVGSPPRGPPAPPGPRNLISLLLLGLGLKPQQKKKRGGSDFRKTTTTKPRSSKTNLNERARFSIFC